MIDPGQERADAWVGGSRESVALNEFTSRCEPDGRCRRACPMPEPPLRQVAPQGVARLR